jgi:hypothetical protein
MGSLLPSNTYAGKDIDLWQPAGDNQTITGNLVVVGTTECDAAVTCNNTLNVTNEITAGSITVPAGIITGAIISATDGFACTGSATITGSFIVNGINCNGDFDMPLGNMKVLSSNPPDPPDVNNGNITATRIFGLNGTTSTPTKTVAVSNAIYWYGTENLLVYSPQPEDPTTAPDIEIVMPADIFTNEGPYIGKRICKYLVQPFDPTTTLNIKILYPDYASYSYTLPNISTGIYVEVYYVGIHFFPNNETPYVINWFPSNVVIPDGFTPPPTPPS